MIYPEAFFIYLRGTIGFRVRIILWLRLAEYSDPPVSFEKQVAVTEGVQAKATKGSGIKSSNRKPRILGP